MPYDDRLANRVRTALSRRKGLSERRMFGGLAFLLRGHMCCGVLRDELVVRVGPGRHEEALGRPHARPMDFTGRPMRGFVYVAPPGCKTDKSLREWVGLGVAFVRSLPAKS